MDKLVADQPPLLEYGAVQAMFVVVCLFFQSIYVAAPASEFRLGVGHQCACQVRAAKETTTEQSLNRGKKGIFSRREQMFSAETQVPL